MLSYSILTAREERRYREQLVRFIPVLDRVYLKDFYDKQSEDMRRQQKQAESKARQHRR